MEMSSIVYLFLVVLIILKSSELGKEVRPGSIEAFATLLSVAIANRKKALYPELFSFCSPSWSVPLDRWTSSVSVSRPYDAMKSLYPRFPQPYSRRRSPTGWPLSSSVLYLHQIPDWVNWPLQPRSDYKSKPFYPKPPLQKLHFHPSSASSLFLSTKASLPPASILSSKLFSRVRSRRREEAQSRPKAEINPSCHPWLRLQKSSSHFAGHC
jgi:hypothetical protein